MKKIFFALLFMSSIAQAKYLGVVIYDPANGSTKSINLGSCHGRLEVTENIFLGLGLNLVGNNCQSILVNNSQVKLVNGVFEVPSKFATLDVDYDQLNFYDVILSSQTDGSSDRLSLLVKAKR